MFYAFLDIGKPVSSGYESDIYFRMFSVIDFVYL